ncbi:hypothetical protein NitYY0826_C0332 [Nitratiruptor sp. YY08-26]|uniref:hypothetical protein n=1 Tax=unclassified Nitratiruptor TaxID=2624044 RepID=UPI00191561CC|nr:MULTISPECIES: hypothetical protein [unclassified Nitratiruptor]BCD61480.1 hypothetical protein NitYY0813_C0331 [Nitratiruptor sp. YY08-13]BCD65414.1 hypothetical protein NitYY0826_C0332 [Nitratiruptor sp. YY08-26]
MPHLFSSHYSKNSLNILMIIVLFFSGCAMKQKITSEPVRFVFKTKSIKVAASGFLQRGGSLKLQAYGAGQPLFELILGKRVCINGRCMSYAMFNEKVLSPFYPSYIIRNILESKPIFAGKNLEKRGDGFFQEILDERFAIIYRVTKKGVYFKDSKNKILIKLKELD